MCRHILVTLLFFCRPHDVFMQDPVRCEAGEVTVGQTARITCSFPPGTIVPKSSDFVVKKFGSPRDEDILDCYYPQGSTLDNPDCLIRDTSLGYTFKFVPRNDTQTVIIPSVKLSDAGVYGCDKTGHRIDRCILTVTARVRCEAGEVTVGQTARITCIFHPGTITPNNGGDFVVKKFPGDSKEEDILECYYLQGSTSETLNCVFQNQALGYNFTFVPGNDRQVVVIPSVKLSDAGEYGCAKIDHRIDRCNLTVTGDSGREPGQSDVNIGLIVGFTVAGVLVVVLAAVVVVLYCNVRKWRQVQKDLERVQQDLEWAQKDLGQLSKDLGDNEPNMPLIIDKLKEIQKRLWNVWHSAEKAEYLLRYKRLKKLRGEQPGGEDGDGKYQQVVQELMQVLREINGSKENLGQVQQNLGQVQQELSQAQPDLGQAQADLGQAQQYLDQAQRDLHQALLDFKEMRFKQSETLVRRWSSSCMTTKICRRNQHRGRALQPELFPL